MCYSLHTPYLNYRALPNNKISIVLLNHSWRSTVIMTVHFHIEQPTLPTLLLASGTAEDQGWKVRTEVQLPGPAHEAASPKPAERASAVFWLLPCLDILKTALSATFLQVSLPFFFLHHLAPTAKQSLCWKVVTQQRLHFYLSAFFWISPLYLTTRL